MSERVTHSIASPVQESDRSMSLKDTRVLTFLLVTLLSGFECPGSAREILPGAVVEDVAKASAGEKAGLRPGDILLAWERPANLPANPEKAEGKIASVFDWMWVEMEQRPRGVLRVSGQRDGTGTTFEIPIGTWGVKVRPRFEEEALTAYWAGKAAVAAKELERGIALWATVAKSAESTTDCSIACWMNLRAGDAWAESRHWKEALVAYDSARAVAERANNEVAQALAWESVGMALERQNKFGEAERAYQSAMAVREKVSGESLSVARSLIYLGRVAYARRDVGKADAYYKRALAIQEKLAPDSLTMAISVNSLGEVARSRGEMASAEAYHKRALAIRENLAPDSLAIAASLNGLGEVARNRGELAPAEAYYKRAVAIQEKLAPNSLELAYSLNNLGVVARSRGELTTAEAYYKRALAIREELAPDSIDLAASLGNLGNVAWNRGELTLAEDYYKRSLAIKEKRAPDSLTLAVSLNQLGVAARSRGELTTAVAFHKRALAIQEKLAPDSLDVAHSLNQLGVAARNLGELTTAETYSKRALVIRARLAPGSTAEAQSLYNLGLIYRKGNNTRLAGDHLLRAIDALEAQVSKLGGSQEAQSKFGVQFADYYRDYIDQLLELNQPTAAFHILERSRARTLLAMLAERDLVFAADLSADIEQERKRIAWDYDQTQAKLARLNPAKDKAQIEGLINQIRELRDHQSEIVEQIRRQSPRLASLQYPKPLDLKAAQAALDPGTLLLSYSLGKEKSYLFALTADTGVQVYTLAVGETQLREEIERFRSLIQRARLGAMDLTGLVERGRRLYDLLLQPAAKVAERARRVLVVPDGPLHVLPFAALVRRVDGKTTRAHREWQYLVEWKPVHMVVSATVYAELRKEPQNRGGKEPHQTLIAFGDPSYPAMAASEDEKTLDRQDAVVRSMLTRGYRLTPLPATRSEVAALADLYRDRAATYVGEAATEERAKTVAKGATYLHFASHGVLDERFPLNSGLALTIPTGVKEGQDNGILQAWEILERLRIDADLVVLSACETGLGKEMGGEGLVGLTRAFQYAGARSVLASLWSVADEATAVLMERFYGYLKAGKSKDAALRAAQLDLIRGRVSLRDPARRTGSVERSHPFYWAGFQLTGDWR